METIKNIFKSLYSNQAALDNRKMKWYVTLIMVVFSIFLPWIPTLTNGYKSNGGSVFTTNANYEVSTALKHVLGEEAYFKQVKVKNDNGSYSLDYSGIVSNADYYGETASDATYNWTNEFEGKSDKALFKGSYTDVKGEGASAYVSKATEKKFDYYFDCVGVDVNVEDTTTSSTTTNTSDTTTPDTSDAESSSVKAVSDTTATSKTERRVYLEVYILPELSRKDSYFTQYLANFTSTVILNKDANGVNARAPHSYCFFTKDCLEVYFYPFSATTSTTSASGSYLGNLDDGLSTLAIENETSLYDVLFKNTTINDGFTKNFVSLAHYSARSYTINSVWMNILTLSAISLGCIIVSSILVIIFFKKKTSIYRDSNYFHAINTSTNMALTPALLGMIFGFINSNYTLLAIVGANLIRAVFVMNRICPPQQAESNKPVYQARD